MSRVGARHIGQVTDLSARVGDDPECTSNIGRVTDVRSRSGWHDRDVVITIRLDAIDPPAGRVSRAGEPELAFEGWLGLLRVLSELLASPHR